MSIFVSVVNDIYEKYHKGKFYSWYTNRNMTTDRCYTAFGSKITAAFVQSYGENKKDALDYLSKHLLYAESEYFRLELKGGHRDNAYANAISRKLYRSKAQRRKKRKLYNTTRQLAKGPLDFIHAYKYIQKRVYDNAEDAANALWNSVPSFGKSGVNLIKKVFEVNTAPVTKLSDRQSKSIHF